MKYTPKDKNTLKCRCMEEPILEPGYCIRNITEFKHKKKVLELIGCEFTLYKDFGESNFGGFFDCKYIENYKYEALHSYVKYINQWIENNIGSMEDESNLRLNWKEIRYRKKVTDVLGLKPNASWDNIYNRLISKFK